MVGKEKNMLIGEMLLEEGIITKEQLNDALEEQKRTGEKIGEILIRMGYISKEILWTFLGYQMGVPYINLDEIKEIPQDVLKILPEQLMRNEKLIPISKHGKLLTVAMAEPLNFVVVDDLKATTRCEIDVRLAPEEDIKKLLDKYFGYKEEDTGEITKAQVDELDDIFSSDSSLSTSQTEEPQLKITRSPFGDEVTPKKEVSPKTDEFKVSPPPPPPPSSASIPPKASPTSTSVGSSEIKVDSVGASAMNQDTPVNTFLSTLLSSAYDVNATDIHIEPMHDKSRIRRRIDGILYEVEFPPKTLYNGIVNKIKELSKMNVQEKNKPQESKLKIRVAGKEINMAVYTFPTIFGEKIVLKIIKSESRVVPLTDIGMEPNVLEIYKKYIKMPHGLILITGPTNSGKTTTMYSTLSEINDSSKNIFVIDDTTSNYIIPGINQTKVNRKSYGQVLSLLSEQDCDVIGVGDIANKETAEVIFDVIAGGHLVITKVRANDPYQALQTLINFGIEPYVVYSNTLIVLAQRLVRKICDTCKESYEATEDIKGLLGVTENVSLYKGRGCANCSNTGYKGRTAIFEVLAITEKIKDMLINKEPIKQIKEESTKSGLPTLKDSAIFKVIQGITTVEEFMKIN